MLTIAWRSTAHEIAWRNSLRAIHGAFFGREPRRPQVERKEVGVERDADGDHPQLALVGEPPEGGVILRADVAVAHQVALGRFEPERFGVLIGDDRERQPIEVRQLDAGGVAPEVVRVAREHEPLPGDVLDELKRPEADDLADRA